MSKFFGKMRDRKSKWFSNLDDISIFQTINFIESPKKGTDDTDPQSVTFMLRTSSLSADESQMKISKEKMLRTNSLKGKSANSSYSMEQPSFVTAQNHSSSSEVKEMDKGNGPRRKSHSKAFFSVHTSSSL